MNIIVKYNPMNQTFKKPIQEQKDNSIENNDAQNNILISWIIIGRNWSSTINDLIKSLNKQKMTSDKVELILVDDASTDQSISKFNEINFSNKKTILLNKHSGRTIAQNSGIDAAVGKYCLFTQSNTIPEKSFINQYIKVLSDTKVDGYAGIINYTSNMYLK